MRIVNAGELLRMLTMLAVHVHRLQTSPQQSAVRRNRREVDNVPGRWSYRDSRCLQRARTLRHAAVRQVMRIEFLRTRTLFRLCAILDLSVRLPPTPTVGRDRGPKSRYHTSQPFRNLILGPAASRQLCQVPWNGSARWEHATMSVDDRKHVPQRCLPGRKLGRERTRARLKH